MKYKNYTEWCRRVGLASLLASLPLSFPAVSAQDDEVYELSPFTVDESGTKGYRATSTLAGTRINTNLKDLGAAISVVTEEFLEDTGATGVEDLLQYTTSTEIGGPEGNYSGTDIGGDARFNDDEARRNPSQSARIRGVGVPNYTRNYFTTDVPIDAYNTSGITIARGPNSLLFGLGSPAGVIDNSVKMPVIGENSTEISYRYGSHASNRATFDVVRTVIDGRLAIKASGLYKHTNYRQEPAFDREKRAYFAFTGILLKNENSNFFGPTTLRSNFEFGEGKRTPPLSIVPGVSWESFFRPPTDFSQYNGVEYPGPGYEGLTSTWRKWGTLDTRLQPDGTPGYNENSSVPGEWDLYSTPFFFTSPMTIFQQDGSTAINQDGSGPGGFANWANNQATPNGNPHRPDLFVNTRAYEEGAQGLGFKAPSIPSRDIFDYRNHLMTGDLQRVTRDFDTNTFFLEQSFANNKGGIEVAIDQQDFDTEYYQPFGGGGRGHSIYIDTTEYLIGGSPNPNVGRAFMTNYYTFDDTTNDVTERDNQRFTAFYELDFQDVNDGLGKWLGKHRFTGLSQSEERVSYNTVEGKFVDGVGFDSRGGNDVGWGRMVAPVYYISGDLRGVEENDVRLDAIPNNTIEDVSTFTARYLLNPNDSSEGYEDRQFSIERRIRGGGVNALEVDSEALAWQSYFAGGHIVGLIGIRSDDVTSYGGVPSGDLPGGTDRLPGGEVDIAKRHILRQATADDTQSGDTKTYSVVAHAPQGWIDNLPFSSVSAHWSSAENFQAISVGRDHNNNQIGNPSGETKEIGFSLGFNQNNWLLRVNRFETDSKNVRTAGGQVGNSISWLRNFANRWHEGVTAEIPWEADSPNNAVRWASAAGYNSYAEIISDINTLMPEPARSLYDIQFNEESDEWEYTGPGIQGLVATQAVQSEGWEIELVGNPTDNLRVSLNAVKVDATPTNTAQSLQNFSSQVLSRMRELGFNDTSILEGVQSIVAIQERWNQTIASPVAGLRAKDDTNSQELREWRINGIANYSFTEGRFRGGAIGGALRYQSKVGIGNGLTFDENGIPVPDVNNIFYGPSELNGDFWVSYRKRLADKVDWKIQLNVRNAIGGDDDTIPLFTNPDGVQRLFRVAPETSWFVTNTFSF